MKHKAFTLAEIMIVLTIIGVLTMILLPIANHSRPDENVMKFKKANTTFANVVRELVNSGQYYMEGDLGRLPDGNKVLKYGYLCKTMSDVMSIKKKNCLEGKSLTDEMEWSHNLVAEDWKEIGVISVTVEEYMDNLCAEYPSEELISSDNIVFYETNPQSTFGNTKNMYMTWDREASGAGDHFCWDDDPNCTNNGKFHHVYKVLCIDVDGINKDEAPFGYGLRIDGRIVLGKRAKEWLEKGFQKGKDEN